MVNAASRRDFLIATGAAAAATGLGSLPARQAAAQDSDRNWFEISLAQWSLNRAFYGRSAVKLENLDFPRVAREEFGIGAIEYVNQFFVDKANDEKYLAELDKRAKDHGVKNLLIMVDGEGRLGDPDDKRRGDAVSRHVKWLQAAKRLGCHSIRVNAASSGKYEQQIELAADGLARLSEKATEFGLNVLVENHGGLSSNGSWLAAVIKKVGRDNCGTLPDFGNFRVRGDEWYDRYKGVTELMPFAKAVSAKSHDFNGDGYEIHTDYLKMMKIVRDAGYRGYVGIEYEGGRLGQFAGILATKKLLERVRAELAG